MTGLGRRVLTALVLVPLVVLAVMTADTDMFRWVVAVVALAALWEWGGLAGLTDRVALVVFMGCSVLYLAVLGAAEASGLAFALTVPAALFWLVLTPVLMARRNRPVAPSAEMSIPLVIAGPVRIGATWAALVALHRTVPAGPEICLFLLVMVWVVDSAAYFTGRRFGRHKLAPGISPGKTIEGVAGALVAAAILGATYALSGRPDVPVGGFVLLCAVVALVSVTGDLLESVVKRRHGVKDSGDLLPGHGGVLDRIDSLAAAAPLFYVGISVLESTA